MGQFESISHTGTITAVGKGTIEVAVRPEGACGSCHARTVCGASGNEDRKMTVPVINSADFSEGETVEVSIEKTMGVKAVLLAYVTPFVIMFAVLLIMLQTGFSELSAGISALAAVALWYMVLGMLRRKLDKEIIFKVHKTYE